VGGCDLIQYGWCPFRQENLEIDTHRTGRMTSEGSLCCHKARSQDRGGTDSSLEPQRTVALSTP
jgi:hypothetical protein